MTRARDVANIDGILTTKGDIFAATAAATPARLGVGNNGETLVADSSTSTGLRWQGSQAAGKNSVLNSNYSTWQRGTTFAASAGVGVYTADRWQLFRSVVGGTVTRQLTSDTTNLPNIQYCARIARDSGNTATNNITYSQSFETVNSIPFAGKTVTLSFYARAGANFSMASGALGFQLASGTGTDQNVTSGFTGGSNIINSTATLTTTWQRFTSTVAVPSTSTQLGINYYFTPVGTAGANDYYEITGVQLEVGSTASPYAPNGATQQAELAACQRYYQKSFRQITAPAQNAGLTGAAFFAQSLTGGLNQTVGGIRLPVVMRTVPTITTFNPSAANAQVRNVNSSSDWSATAIEQIGDAGFNIQATGNATSGAGDRAAVHYTAEAEL